MFSNLISKKKLFWIRIGIGAILTISILASLPDIFIYRGALQNNTGISMDLVLLTALISILIVRVLFDVTMGKKFFAAYSFIMVPLLIGLSIVINLLDTFTYPNFTYSTFSIKPSSIFDFSFYLLLFAIPFFDTEFVKKNWRWSLFSAGIIAFFFYVFLKWRLDFIFYWLDGEDGPVEWTQFFLYLASSIIAFITFLKVRKLKNVKKRLRLVWLTLLLISALGLLFVAKEEISWGQRLFNIETPERLLEINRQDETNIHNIDGVFGRVYDAYLALGFYGISSWLLFYIPIKIKGVRLRDYFRPVLSRWYLMPYFLVMIGYVFWRYNGPETGYHLWEEASELFLATGIFIIFLRGYKYIKNYNRSK